MKYILTGIKIIDQTHLEIVVKLTFRKRSATGDRSLDKTFTRYKTVKVPGWMS